MLISGVVVLGGATRAGENKGAEIVLDGLKSRVPAIWKKEATKSKFRFAQFRVPHADGDVKDAELVIFFFDGGGGSVDDNVKRWKSQFRAPEGKSIDDVSKLETFKVGDVKVTYLDIQGTYLSRFPPFDPNAKITPLPNYRRVSVYFDCKNGPYFFNLLGPAKTVAKNKKGFDDWLKGFK
jgi:hypothetical protein